MQGQGSAGTFLRPADPGLRRTAATPHLLYSPCTDLLYSTALTTKG